MVMDKVQEEETKSSQAWTLLSEKAKRSTYNQTSTSQTLAPVKKGGSKPKIHRGPTTTPTTFWTVCHGCKMQYEYLKVYLNQTLLCPNCHNPFVAKESSPPVVYNKSKPVVNQHHDSINNNQYYSSRSITTENSFTDPAIASKAANVIQRVNERLKREREELSAKMSQPSFTTTTYQMNNSTTNGVTYGVINNSNYKISTRELTRELTVLETRNMLIKKARKEICKKLNSWHLETHQLSTNKVNGNSSSSSTTTKTVINQMMNTQEEAAAMSVPDPDFHNFDSDRMENSFQDYQVWSAYDDDDGMPRFYAIIHKVISRKPLEMKISWLNSKTTAEFGNMEWINSGFRKTCGEFRVGKFQTNTNLNSFSQKVKFTKTPRGSVVIHPKKGDVWALYRNWDCGWNESVPDHVVHQYDMVEVVDDYDEKEGVSVRPLVKLSGYRTVFGVLTDVNQVKKIPKQEMLRFSHQVPKYLLTGKEGFNSPKGYLELDPAATPLELIHKTS